MSKWSSVYRNTSVLLVLYIRLISTEFLLNTHTIERDKIRISDFSLTSNAKLTVRKAQDFQVQSLLEITFWGTLFCSSFRKPTLPTLYNYGKPRTRMHWLHVETDEEGMNGVKLYLQSNEKEKEDSPYGVQFTVVPLQKGNSTTYLQYKILISVVQNIWV